MWRRRRCGNCGSWCGTGPYADVLLKVYAKCLAGDRERMNARIETALSE
jgi:hypothetical protein